MKKALMLFFAVALTFALTSCTFTVIETATNNSDVKEKDETSKITKEETEEIVSEKESVLVISQKQTESTKTNTSSKANTSTYKGFTDEEINDLVGEYYDNFNENGPCFGVGIETINGMTAYINVNYVGPNLSPVYTAENITVQLKYKNSAHTELYGDFIWQDSWSNEGTGTITFSKNKPGKMVVNTKLTKEAEGNRATLATNKDVTITKY